MIRQAGPRRVLGALCLLWVAASTTAAGRAAAPSTERLSWSVLEDPGGLLDADAVRARDAAFSEAAGRHINPGYSRSAWWGRVTIAPTGTAETRWLVMRVARLEQVQMWIERPGGWQHAVAGTTVPHAEWPLDTPTASFPVERSGDRATTIYLRLAGRNALSFDAVLCVPSDCQRTQHELLALEAALAGCLALVIAGCLLLAAMQRDTAPLLVANYALLYALYEAAYQGHAFQYLWPDATDGASRVMNPLAASSVAALSLVLCAFSPASGGVGRVRRVLLVLVMLLAPAIAYAWFGDYRTAAAPVLSLCFVAMGVGAVLGVTVWRHGTPQGGYLAIVGVMTLLGTLPRYGYLAGLLPHSAWTVYTLPLTSLADSLVLVAAVLARLRFTDIARQASQAALLESRAAHAERSRLLADLGHDLRAPLAATINHLRRLEPGIADDATRRAHAERAVAHQLELIDELMRYARDDAEPPELAPAAHFLHALLADVADQGAALARENGNRFASAIAPDLPPVVHIDANRVRRVLLNLLSNAAKFTRDGQIRMEVVLTGTADMPRLRCVVGDTGPGIAAADLPRIFEPLWRSRANRTDTPGTGLGLAIAKRLTEAMGGTLTAASAPGAGSRFTAELPIGIGATADVQWPALTAATPSPFGSGRTALVVDPDPASREHLAELLFAAAFDVLLVSDAEQAIALLADRRADLLITEQDLPGASGWHLLSRCGARVGSGAPMTVLYSARPPQRPPDLPDALRFSAHELKPLGGDAWWALLAGGLGPRAAPLAQRAS
jgi:signal transduction histidine kinase